MGLLERIQQAGYPHHLEARLCLFDQQGHHAATIVRFGEGPPQVVHRHEGAGDLTTWLTRAAETPMGESWAAFLEWKPAPQEGGTTY